ncbi:hypothetical protein BKA64DRAFT_667946 [Cadophora sp. MPI-SDFR-AT-0126]|nr:hypothetical protein BKA64DRAFT_667946 [Leotiomycetes sp. MPI-SDFR-AT-0126]
MSQAKLSGTVPIQLPKNEKMAISLYRRPALDHARATRVQLGIQNMTWSGSQGFQSGKMGKFVVAPFDEYVPETYSALGQVGTTHTERGLTYILVQRAGHYIPVDAPGGFYKAVEFLLGRRDDIEGGESFFWPFDYSPSTPVEEKA